MTCPVPPRFLLLGAFLFAGEMKASPFLSRSPADLTLLSAGALGLTLLARWMRGARAASSRGLGLAGLWYLTFLPGVLDAADTPYAFQKVGTLFSLSLLASLAPFLLVRREEDLLHLLDGMALFCLIITADGLLGLDPSAQRLEAMGGGTISLGRAAGFLFLHGALRFPEAGRPASRPPFRPPFRFELPVKLLALAAAAAGAVALVFSGSRGPLAGALAALLLAAAGSWPAAARARARVLLGGAALALALALSLALAPQGSLRRTQAFLQGQFGPSELYRAQAARACWSRIGRFPWGLGWGGFATQVDLDSGAARQYPHNLLLEATLESGWICGAFTVLVLACALGAAWRRRREAGGRILLAGAVFSVANALVSGDLNDNRPLFALASASLALWKPRRDP